MDDRSPQLMTRLRERVGEQQYRKIMASILDNLEAYAIARDEGLTDSQWGTVLQIPEGELDRQSQALVTELLDHALQRVTSR